MTDARKTEGASKNRDLSVKDACISSFRSSLTPSASVCNKPQGPVWIGPTRSCIQPMILRSARIKINPLVRTKPKKEMKAIRNCKNDHEKMTLKSWLPISSAITLALCTRSLQYLLIDSATSKLNSLKKPD